MSLGSFTDALTLAIDESHKVGAQIIVLRIRPRTINLTSWSTGLDTRIDGLNELLMGRMRAVDEDIALFRSGRRDYLCFISGSPSRSEAEKVAGRIATGLSGSVAEVKGLLVIAPQVGAALVDDENPTAEMAIEAASLTIGQTTPEAPFLIYAPYVRAASQRELRTEEDLALAITNNQLGVNFQARLSCKTGDIDGMEVFVRWSHHSRGDVPVPELLRVAERIGILFDLGALVRDMSHLAAIQWRREGLFANQRLWFNIAPVELFNSDMLTSLDYEILDEVNVGFDLADSALLDEKLVVDKIAEMRAHGIGVALDRVVAPADCLSRVKRLPLSAVNLSGDLVRQYTVDGTVRDLVAAIIQIAHDRGSEVTATQIESRQQMEVSRAIGVDHIQGNFIHAPCPPERMTELLRDLKSVPERRSAELDSGISQPPPLSRAQRQQSQPPAADNTLLSELLSELSGDS